MKQNIPLFLVLFLKREEAILILKELFEKCTDMDGRYMSLVPPTSVEPIAHGYQIHIRAGLDILTEKMSARVYR
jgi:hypothetical protein